MPVRITALEAERFKRIHAVSLEPRPEGLTVIGGRNGQGKTSVLDAIVFALGGEKYRPSTARNRDSDKPARIEIKLSNGLVVTRGGNNGTLKVIDRAGLRGGQGVLDKFMEKLALDLPKFMQSSPKDKAKVLLRIIGAGDDLYKLDVEEAAIYLDRTLAGKSRDAAANVLGAMERVEAPVTLVSVSDLVELLDQANAIKVQKRDLQDNQASRQQEIASAIARIQRLKQDIEVYSKRLNDLDVPDIDLIRQRIAAAEETNDAVRNNIKYHEQASQAEQLKSRYADLDSALSTVRDKRKSLLDGVKMPLDGLSIEDGELIYNGCKWDCMSSTEQLKVATSIVRELNPDCGFVLLDKLEQMDVETMTEFGEWAKSLGLQIIATRVSTGDECSLVIEDGQVKD